MATHQCPVANCPQNVPYHHLMCAPHWATVPPQLQHEVYHRYARGKGAGTREHAEACLAAVAAVDAKTQPTAL